MGYFTNIGNDGYNITIEIIENCSTSSNLIFDIDGGNSFDKSNLLLSIDGGSSITTSNNNIEGGDSF